MFTPIHLLPQFNGIESGRHQNRWRDFNEKNY